MSSPDLPDDLAGAAARVRQFLLDAGFTTDGVMARMGSASFAALGRGLTVPVRRALAAYRAQPDAQAPGAPPTPGATPTPPPVHTSPHLALDHLIGTFLLGDPLPPGALPAGVEADLAALGMLRHEPGRSVPTVEVHPYGEPDTDWFLVSDAGAPQRPDHVLGLGGASLTLARITPRQDVGRALDLGCGAGVQVLHAGRHATRVVATDTNPRALAMTRLSAALSDVPAEQLDLREGSLFGPVADERFDLVVSNPPFVISPSHRFTYRDAGLPGDELSRLVVRGAAAHLAPGGVAAVLANWLHVAGEAWGERVSEWVAGTGAAAWIVQRDTQSVADYAATWLRDAGVAEGEQFDAAMNEWLDVFADEAATEVGFGWVVLVAPRRVGAAEPGGVPGGAAVSGGSGTAESGAVPGGANGPESAGHEGGRPGHEPWVLVEDLSSSPRLPRGDEVAAFLAGCAALVQLDAPTLLASRARLADAATATTTTHFSGGTHVDAPPQLGLAGIVGTGGWRPAITVHPVLFAALLADRDAPIGERVDAAAQAEGLDPLDVLGPVLMGLRELVRVGIVRTV
jgi:methylase of polypeptide subunit release factors